MMRCSTDDVQAARMGGQPWMMSFSGMGEVLGWASRLPLVADSDRPHILAGWAQACAGRTPHQRYVPFTALRNLSPEEFVAVLAEDFRVAGVVVGENYRFGYKAAGDAKLLQELAHQHGISVAITELMGAGVPGRVGQVSSSKVRHFLGLGRMRRVEDLLGRRYRLIASMPCEQIDCPSPSQLRVPAACFCNQPPRPQQYWVELTVSSASGSQQSFLDVRLDLWSDMSALLTLPSPLQRGKDDALQLVLEF
ncbi:hypothetical protein WJX84_001082 [Apatococcus fuscideae]|uniref:FAD synthase n=1 Tax=Apatococcus fuscideae TaxID=2026836 RepID=A0AAW1TBN9_9CHLO